MFAASKTASASSGGYQISRSLRFNSADSAYLNRTPASASNQKTWTFSAWVKKSKLGAFQTLMASSYTYIQFTSNDEITVDIGTGTSYRLTTTPVYRDPSAWYHIVVVCDTTQATAADRLKLYVNNTQITAFGTSTYTGIPQNQNTNFNSTLVHWIGGNNLYGDYSSSYMAEINFIDGQALTPSSFGETNAQTGVWQPKAYSGSYGTNGFYLNFSDNSNTTATTLGKDYSGNGNNWTPNNFSVTAGAGNDSLVDSPTSYGTDTGVGGTVRGNYCTLNPLAVKTASAVTLSNGNLDVATVTSGDICYATMGMSSGKWYWEITGLSGVYMLGISKDVTPLTDWQTANGFAYYSANGNKYTNGSGSAYGATFTTGDVIGLALDMDAGTLTYYKNGTSQGTAFSGLSGTYFASVQNPGANGTSSFNFGQRAFANTAPNGYKALCTQNLPTPTIGATTATQAGKYFNPVLYTGNSGVNVVTGMGFQPDMLWQKDRTSTGNNVIDDAVRGINNVLITNQTLAELTGTTYLTSFDSDGFSMNTASPAFNFSGRSYVAWGWKANGSGSTNTSGSITSTVSANTTSGFSIVTYSGQSAAGTIGHGLGVAPSWIIVKNRSSASPGAWTVYSSYLGNTSLMFLNTTDAVYTGNTAWNSTSPTSSVFSVGPSSLSTNTAGNNFVAYCFAPIAGFSAMGSFTGNGSTNFIYTGFRPAYVLIRRTNTAAGWGILDSARNPYNSANIYLNANESSADGVGTAGSQYVDLLSNGFKCLDASGGFNASGDTYIYMAFASAPFKYALAR